jgi:hypothetical protein
MTACLPTAGTGEGDDNVELLAPPGECLYLELNRTGYRRTNVSVFVYLMTLCQIVCVILTGKALPAAARGRPNKLGLAVTPLTYSVDAQFGSQHNTDYTNR